MKLRLPDFEVSKLFLNATHTHNAPVTREGRYTLPESGYGAVIQSSLVAPEGGQVLVDRTVDAINALWPQSK